MPHDDAINDKRIPRAVRIELARTQWYVGWWNPDEVRYTNQWHLMFFDKRKDNIKRPWWDPRKSHLDKFESTLHLDFKTPQGALHYLAKLVQHRKINTDAELVIDLRGTLVGKTEEPDGGIVWP